MILIILTVLKVDMRIRTVVIHVTLNGRCRPNFNQDVQSVVVETPTVCMQIHTILYNRWYHHLFTLISVQVITVITIYNHISNHKQCCTVPTVLEYLQVLSVQVITQPRVIVLNLNIWSQWRMFPTYFHGFHTISLYHVQVFTFEVYFVLKKK